MGLYKRGKRWYYEFWVDGVRYQASTRQTNKREAERIISVKKGDVTRRRAGLPPKSVKFREVSERFEELCRSNSRPSYSVEKFHIKNHLVPYFGDIAVHAITREVVENYKRKRLKEKVSKSTVNRELSTLKSILKYATDSQFAPEGLGRNAQMFSGVENKPKHALTPGELGSLLEVCDSLEFRVRAPYLSTLVWVGTYSGQRPSEIVRMRWSDLDLERGVLWVRKSKTPKGLREVPIHPQVLECLRRWRLRARSEWVFESPKKPGAHITDFGKGFEAAARNAGEHIKDFGKAFEKAAKQAGLHGVSPYYLRHTFITWLENGEQRRSVLLTLRGHTRESHGDPYLHPDWQDKVAAIERLPLPAKVPTVLEPSVIEAEPEDGKLQVPEELVMVGPWGLEPQTSTVSR